ncbi:uncharacterized protein P174DRAFT_159551 [Aspergillus novofumigatus IBT 16806]|uniref:Uncharacterized protein n=1 Tax=Aspergillus novofumigatus (strain IBT 16806) TaxID=1392255 RepID=A0A2I1C7U5_ASPN1|nr:uncharacterized protein P174DRAFT_159551 [Aspergillus novofumigatus IBT 16806]PKX93714.1 hypothetical protein P174DRAFT_159551 [Aspergillus novofumigatus IBT 16806]
MIPQIHANSDFVSKACWAGNNLDRLSFFTMVSYRQLHCASRNVWYAERMIIEKEKGKMKLNCGMNITKRCECYMFLNQMIAEIYARP